MLPRVLVAARSARSRPKVAPLVVAVRPCPWAGCRCRPWPSRWPREVGRGGVCRRCPRGDTPAVRASLRSAASVAGACCWSSEGRWCAGVARSRDAAATLGRRRTVSQVRGRARVDRLWIAGARRRRIRFGAGRRGAARARARADQGGRPSDCASSAAGGSCSVRLARSAGAGRCRGSEHPGMRVGSVGSRIVRGTRRRSGRWGAVDGAHCVRAGARGAGWRPGLECAGAPARDLGRPERPSIRCRNQPGATRSRYTCPHEGNMPVRGPKAELLPIGKFWRSSDPSGGRSC